MSATKSLPLSGGTLQLTTTGVNYFDADEHERKLLADITEAIRSFERKVQAAGTASAKVPEEQK